MVRWMEEQQALLSSRLGIREHKDSILRHHNNTTLAAGFAAQPESVLEAAALGCYFGLLSVAEHRGWQLQDNKHKER